MYSVSKARATRNKETESGNERVWTHLDAVINWRRWSIVPNLISNNINNVTTNTPLG